MPTTLPLLLRVADDYDGASKLDFAVARLTYRDVQALLAAMTTLRQLQATDPEIQQLQRRDQTVEYAALPRAWEPTSADGPQTFDPGVSTATATFIAAARAIVLEGEDLVLCPPGTPAPAFVIDAAIGQRAEITADDVHWEAMSDAGVRVSTPSVPRGVLHSIALRLAPTPAIARRHFQALAVDDPAEAARLLSADPPDLLAALEPSDLAPLYESGDQDIQLAALAALPALQPPHTAPSAAPPVTRARPRR